MEITEREVGDVIVLDLVGEMMMGFGDEEFSERIQGLLNRGKCKIVLNMPLLSYVDSMGLYVLIKGYSMTAKHGQGLKLLRLSKKVQDLLAITKLLTVFETYDSEDEAIRSFADRS